LDPNWTQSCQVAPDAHWRCGRCAASCRPLGHFPRMSGYQGLRAIRCSHQKSCHAGAHGSGRRPALRTGSGRCPRQNCVPAFRREDKEGRWRALLQSWLVLPSPHRRR
jgi:hypothetical protein